MTQTIKDAVRHLKAGDQVTLTIEGLYAGLHGDAHHFLGPHGQSVMVAPDTPVAIRVDPPANWAPPRQSVWRSARDGQRFVVTDPNKLVPISGGPTHTLSGTYVWSNHGPLRMEWAPPPESD